MKMVHILLASLHHRAVLDYPHDVGELQTRRPRETDERSPGAAPGGSSCRQLDPTIGHELAQELEHELVPSNGQLARRPVEHEHLGVVHEGARQMHQHLVADAERFDPPSVAPRLRARQEVRPGVTQHPHEPSVEAHPFADPHDPVGLELGVAPIIPGTDRKIGPSAPLQHHRGGPDVEDAEVRGDEDLASGRIDDLAQQLDQRRLATAPWADHRHEATLVDGQGDV
mmetsp:Transcript_70876/g.217224  ORF Transcript_70876/g.217224 Transcript_70876/m.217224 type:complete len:227 (+) Transcript_70876:569-1249(+)